MIYPSHPGPKRHLILMLKEPRPGRVKTRLGKEIGMVTAAWWYRHQTAKLLRRINRPNRWQLWLAVTPDVDGMKSRVWPRQISRVAQGNGNLGDRMGRLFRRMPHGPVLIIGSDVPDITERHIARGFAKLQPGKAVIGPGEDGGYWMIGLPRHSSPVPQKLFHNVRWSGPYAKNDTIVSLGTMQVTEIDCLQDIDTLEDLRRYRRRSKVQCAQR